MTSKKRGLGRGLSTLGVEELLSIDDNTAAADLVELSIDRLQPNPDQPRRQMSPAKLQELADSIRKQGIIQPLIVRPMQDHYEIIAGERRFRAAQQAGCKTVPVIIRSISDETMMAWALIENIQREDLNAIEEALALQRLMQNYQMTHQEIAETVGKSRAAISNSLRLLKLNRDVQQFVEQGHLEMGHARALLTVTGPRQSILADRVVRYRLSVRETEALVRGQEKKSISVAHRPSLDPDIARLQMALSDQLGAPVAIRHHAEGKGKLIIQYTSLEELESILERMQ